MQDMEKRYYTELVTRKSSTNLYLYIFLKMFIVYFDFKKTLLKINNFIF